MQVDGSLPIGQNPLELENFYKSIADLKAILSIKKPRKSQHYGAVSPEPVKKVVLSKPAPIRPGRGRNSRAHRRPAR
jgi:hypothetical protein